MQLWCFPRHVSHLSCTFGVFSDPFERSNSSLQGCIFSIDDGDCLLSVWACTPGPQWSAMTLLASFPCPNPQLYPNMPIWTHKCPRYPCMDISSPLFYACHVLINFAMFCMWYIVCLRTCLVCLRTCLGVFPLCMCTKPNPEHIHLCDCPFPDLW